ncbi:hypothetical protein OUZ56_012295 [Daphnia magna]|uniref:Uncharacterized protein n=1 Tax=Daphnia magna TaxID=35525 RepID=A0ABQ9Z2S1_9CRUS|nr:hypothetical protein OUZ56_012295 [Daphnia magna]
MKKKMRTNEDSGVKTTFERRSLRKGLLMQRFVPSVQYEYQYERITPLRSGGGSPSISRYNENRVERNESVEPGSDGPHQSDIDLIDSSEIRKLKNDDQWNEVLNIQVAAQENEALVEPLIGDKTRELL